jgi:hypothetical protein
MCCGCDCDAESMEKAENPKSRERTLKFWAAAVPNAISLKLRPKNLEQLCMGCGNRSCNGFCADCGLSA